METEITTKQLRQKAIVEEIKFNNGLIWQAARTTRACHSTIAALRKEFLTLERELYLLNKRAVVVLPAFPPSAPIAPRAAKPALTPVSTDKLLDQALACFGQIPLVQQDEVIALLLNQLSDDDDEPSEETLTTE